MGSLSVYTLENVLYINRKIQYIFLRENFSEKNTIFRRVHTLSRKDSTFCAADIVRFWCKNLDPQEQLEVFVFFVLFVPAVAPVEVFAAKIEQHVLRLVPARPARQIVRILLRFFPRVIRLRTDILVLLLRPALRAVVRDCLEDIRQITGERRE